MKLTDAKVVSLAVDGSKKILAALVKDAISSQELVYRFYIDATDEFKSGHLINAHPTELNDETVLLQALMPSTT